jgi:stage 0 sporulation regulatory protein
MVKGKSVVSNKEMIHLIETKRAELIQIALKDGLSSSEALCRSQELDNLLNEYYRKMTFKMKIKCPCRKKGK